MVRENTNPLDSKHRGFFGWYERTLRRHKRFILGLTLLPFYFLVAALLGLAAAPAIYWVQQVFEWAETLSLVTRLIAEGSAIGMGFFIFGFASILIVPIPNLLVKPFLKPFRGPYYSLNVFFWYVHNILTYSVRYSFLEWITPTPFNLMFYRFMGMKIGRNVEINSTHISDPGMIVLEDSVTIGGSAAIIAHYAAHGYLVIAPVTIRKNATIGLRAIVMGGVEIGEGAKVLPNSVVLPKTVIPAGETWAGVPARKLDFLPRP
jgi:acetyltransferase-like isoleucine patch superfamily enzyme